MITTDLKDKAALVTGSGKKAGIGYGIVRRLAESGANVIIADLVGKEIRQNQPLGDAMAEMIRLAARFGRGLPADVIPLEVSALAGFGHAEMLAALGRD